MNENIQAGLADLLLACKYARLWFDRVFPNGSPTQRQDLSDDRSPSPVRLAVYRHDTGDGHYTFKDGRTLPLLRPGVEAWEDYRSTVSEPLHPGVPRDMRFLKGCPEDYSNHFPDYLTIIFSQTCTPYILLESNTQEPKWLRDLFYKVRDPNYSEIHLKVKWVTTWVDNVLTFMMGVYAETSRATLRLYKAKRMYKAGEKLVLGGQGLANVTDKQFLVAFQRHPRNTETEIGAASASKHKSGARTKEDVIRDNIQFVACAVGSTPPGEETLPRDTLPDIASPARLRKDDPEDATYRIATYQPADSSVNYEGPPATMSATSTTAKDTIPEYCGCVETYHDAWLPKLVKSIKRGRLRDVQKMVKADLEMPPEISYLASNDITYIQTGDTEGLAVDLAVRNGQLEMLCILIAQCRCGMSYNALQFLVRNFDLVPAAYGSARQLLLQYLLRHPAPLAVATATIRALRTEIKRRHKINPTLELEEGMARMQTLQLLILNELKEMQRQRGGLEIDLLPRLKRILDPLAPQVSPVLISDLPPLRIALEDQDPVFMDASLVQEYTSKTWRGAELMMECCKDSSNELTMLDPLLAFNVLCNIGLASPGMSSLAFTCRLFHQLHVGQQAFFNSPRARWCMAFLGTLVYLFAFLQLVDAQIWPDFVTVEENDLFARMMRHRMNTIFFAVLTAGNIVEALIVLLVRYKKDALEYIKRSPSAFFYLAVDVILLALTIHLWRLLYSLILVPPEENPDFEVTQARVQTLTLVAGSMSPFICGRILSVIVPIVTSLGPMLNTMQGMVMELFIFVLPWLAITAGFAIALQVAYSGYVNEVEALSPLNSFWSTVFMLLQGFTDKLDYTIFDDLPSQELRVYGKVLFMFYTITNGLLLGNLLIAIITNRYKPEQVRQIASLNMAELIDYYQFQVTACWLSSPWCLVQLACFWLPAGKRQKINIEFWDKRGLPLLDGFTAASMSEYPTLPKGRDEIPHLLYLLTLHPMTILLWLVLFAAHTPLCALYFALHGYKKALRQARAMLGIGSFSSGRHQPPASAESFAAASQSSLAVSSVSLGRVSTRLSQSGGSTDELSFATASRQGTGDWSAALISRRSWLSGLQKSVCTIGFFVTGSMFFSVVHVLGQLLWLLVAWMAALMWSCVNIARGITDLFGKQRKTDFDCSIHQGKPYTGSKAPMPWDNSEGAQCTLSKGKLGVYDDGLGLSYAHGRNKVHPEGSVKSARPSEVKQRLKQVLLDVRSVRQRNPAYIDKDTLRDLIQQVVGGGFKLNLDDERQPQKEEPITDHTSRTPAPADGRVSRAGQHDTEVLNGIQDGLQALQEQMLAQANTTAAVLQLAERMESLEAAVASFAQVHGLTASQHHHTVHGLDMPQPAQGAPMTAVASTRDPV